MPKTLKALFGILLILSLIFISACSIWPFAKKDTAGEASALKKKTGVLFASVEKNAGDFDIFLNKLKKRWYTTEDTQDFANSLATFQNKFKQDQNSLKELKEKLLLLTELDKERKFAKYIQTTTKASGSLGEALVNSENIVKVLSPKFGALAKLFSLVDEIKQEQSRYIVAIGSDNARQVQAALAKQLMEQALLASTAVSETDTEAGTETANTETSTQTGSTNDSNSETSNTQESNTTAETSTTSTSSTSSTSSDTDLDQWAYIISQNTWPSTYVKDFVKEASDSFNRLYIDVYQIHKIVALKNSGQLKDYLQQIKEDVADYSASIEAIIDNLKEQKRLTGLKERDSRLLATAQASHQYATAQQAGRPAGVSGQSVANEGFGFLHEYSHKQIDRYQDKIKSYNERLTELKKVLGGSLNSDYKDASWKFSGSLLTLHKANINISRYLIRDIKAWKRKAIAKYVYLRLESLVEAKRQNNQANKAYIEAKSKIASK